MNKFKKASSLVLALLLVVTLFAGCKSTQEDAYNKSQIDSAAVAETASNPETPESTPDATTVTEEAPSTQTVYPYEFNNKFGAPLVLDAEPMHIISLSPELTETIYALGAGDKLIGRSSYCDYPAEAKSVEEVGTLFELNLEVIIAKAPDLVILSSMASEDLVNSLTDKGLKVFIADYDSSFAGTMAYMLRMGEILNKQAEAKALTDDIVARIQAVDAKVATADKPLTYFVTGAGEYGDSAATGDTYIGQMIELAGGENAAKDGTNWQYSIEQLIVKDPTIMICSSSYEMKAQIETLEGYKDLTAVKEGKLYEVDENLFYRQGPRIAEGIEVLAKILHPDLFQ